MSSNNEIANELQKLNEKSYIQDCIEEQEIEEELKQNQMEIDETQKIIDEEQKIIDENQKIIDENQKKYDEKLKELIDAGGFSMEGIIEIKMLCHLIKNCPSEFENKKEDMAKCLEILVNMSNQFLQLYKKQNE